jgi:hypothetical protein
VIEVKVGQPKKLRICLEKLVHKVHEILFSEKFLEQARKYPAAFTRNRKMPLISVIGLMINQIKSSTQAALEHFLDLIGRCEISISQQAYSKARQNLRWQACRYLMDESIHTIYEAGYSTWNGYRVSAIDGSKMQLPSDPNLRHIFGTTGRNETAVTAQSSCLYDVLNGFILDARIVPMATDERSLAIEHMDHLASMPSFKKELIIFDRGYPSFELLRDCEKKHISYLMRLRSKFNVDIDQMSLGSHLYTLKQGKRKIPLRVVKFNLPTGEIETLITNVFDRRMGEDAFRKLYFKRWPIETQYAHLKHKLEIENFSCRTEEGIYQDYYVTVFLSNLIAAAAAEAQPIIDEAREDTNNRYEYQVNINRAVGVFKDRLILALLEDNPVKRADRVTNIIQRLTKKLTPIRPDRPVPRNPNPRKANFHFNQKSNC